ncbi:MAG: hypothetical protein HZB46_04030 [Solirubrobacterales bacterium]|nr:hypothetical protein [Solirubrobacterales bacterium]
MRLAAAVLLALAALAGCGGDDEPSPEEAVRAAVQRFGDATAKKDYREICDQLLSSRLVERVEGVGLPCEQALQRGLGDVKNPRIRIGDIGVQGGRALVSVRSTADNQPPSDDAVELVREGGEWKIASLAAPDEGGGAATTTTPQATTTEPTPDHDDR